MKNNKLHWQNLLTKNDKIGSLRDGMIGHTIKSLTSSSSLLKNKFVLLGVPDERGVVLNLGNPGSQEGPQEFRNCFYKLYDTSVNAEVNQSYLGELFVDLGNIKLEKTIEETHENIAIVVQEVLNFGAEVVFVIGGGHDFSYGSYKGHAQWSKETIVPIFNFDAHLDVRPVEKNEMNNKNLTCFDTRKMCLTKVRCQENYIRLKIAPD